MGGHAFAFNSFACQLKICCQSFPVLIGESWTINFAHGQTNAVSIIFNLDDAQGDGLSNLENFFGVLNAFIADFRDVNKAFKVTGQVQTGKCTEIGQPGNFALHQLSNFKAGNMVSPGITLELANGQTNTLAVAIDGNYFNFDFIADF